MMCVCVCEASLDNNQCQGDVLYKDPVTVALQNVKLAFIPRHYSRVDLGALTHHSALLTKHVSKQLLPQAVVAG